MRALLMIVLIMFITESFCESDTTTDEEAGQYRNVCLEEIVKTANSSTVFRVLQIYGETLTVKRKFSKRFLNELIEEAGSEKEFLEVTDDAFIEASWCHRNAQWVAHVFVGKEMENPLVTFHQIPRFFRDIKKDISNGVLNGVYLCTVPRFLKSDDSPKNFFYRTHWFVIQTIPVCETVSPCFRIYSGFARHYRMIDYLSPWKIQDHIDSEHPLKIDHTKYAGVDMSIQTLEEYLRKTDLMIQEINDVGKWNKKVNDLHKELYFADKYKDMIELYKIDNKYNGQKIEEYNYHEKEFDITIVPQKGGYQFTARKYHYQQEDCIKNAQVMRARAYGKHFSPSKPLKLSPDYGQINH